MAEARTVSRDWNGPVIVAAAGPSLTESVAWECRQARWFGPYRIVAVSDAYKRLPNADILYSCDAEWWKHHKGAVDFGGERWSSQGDEKTHNDDKFEVADLFGVNLVRGLQKTGFSLDPAFIHYGNNSGFQAVNLAILKGATKVVLVGFDMQKINGQSHYFGEHPAGLRTTGEYRGFIKAFEAAKPPVPVVNATPGSALRCYPMVDLKDTLREELDQWSASPIRRSRT